MTRHEYSTEYPPRRAAATLVCHHEEQVIMGHNVMKCAECGSRAERPATWMGAPWELIRRTHRDGRVREPVLNFYGDKGTLKVFLQSASVVEDTL